MFALNDLVLEALGGMAGIAVGAGLLFLFEWWSFSAKRRRR